MKVNVRVVPASGESSDKEVEVTASGASVAEIRRQAGIDNPKMLTAVNGEPATDKTHVGVGDSVTFTEKARGS